MKLYFGETVMNLSRRSFMGLAGISSLLYLLPKGHASQPDTKLELPPIIVDAKDGMYTFDDEWLNWLRRRQVEPSDTYRVELWPEQLKMTVYQYLRKDGRHYTIGYDLARRLPYNVAMYEYDPLPSQIAALPRAWRTE